jgi:hypothetical protein
MAGANHDLAVARTRGVGHRQRLSQRVLPRGAALCAALCAAMARPECVRYTRTYVLSSLPGGWLADACVTVTCDPMLRIHCGNNEGVRRSTGAFVPHERQFWLGGVWS